MTPELQAQVAIWRSKAINGTLTPEDELEAIRVLREGRVSAAVSSENSKKRAAAKAAPAPDGNDLLNELLGDL